MKREHTMTVGSHRVVCDYEAVQLDDGSYAMRSEDYERLGVQAAVAVFQRVERITGEELLFARKAMGLTQPDLGKLLDVDTEAVSRWETGADPIQRQTLLAVLLYLEHMARNGVPTQVDPSDDTSSVRLDIP